MLEEMYVLYAIGNNHYMLNLVLILYKKLLKKHSKSGFELRKFVSDSDELIQPFWEEDVLEKTIVNTKKENSNIGNISGLYWNYYKEDVYTFQLKSSKMPEGVLEARRRPTKREVLSIVNVIWSTWISI